MSRQPSAGGARWAKSWCCRADTENVWYKEAFAVAQEVQYHKLASNPSRSTRSMDVLRLNEENLLSLTNFSSANCFEVIRNYEGIVKTYRCVFLVSFAEHIFVLYYSVYP